MVVITKPTSPSTAGMVPKHLYQGRYDPGLYRRGCIKVTEALRAKGVQCDDVVIIPNVVTYGTFFDPEGNCFQFASSPV